MNRYKAKKIAEDTLRILKSSAFSEDIVKSKNNTATISPNRTVEFGNGLIYRNLEFKDKGTSSVKIKITEESVLQASSRLSKFYPCVLNFANATSPGGGFLRGAIAQEETICRSSALYESIKDSSYYSVHREESSVFLKGAPAKNQIIYSGLAYTDTVIYSPDVVVFKNDAGEIIEPYKVCFVTSPAPMRSSIESLLDPDPDEIDEALDVLIRLRVKRILDVMARFNHKTLILGGWGCGAFGNDPYMVAQAFKDAIDENGNFDRILFPMYGDKKNYEIFKEVLE